MVPIFERPNPPAEPRRLRVFRLAARRPDTAGDRAAHWLLTVPWSKFVATLAGFYLATASFFAAGFLRLGGLDNVQSASFADAFFISLQALSVFGCGRLAPSTPAAKALAAGAIFIGWISLLLFLAMTMVRFIRLRPFFRAETSLALSPTTPELQELTEEVPASQDKSLN